MPTTQSAPNATLMFNVQIQNGGSRPRVYDFDDQVWRLVKWQPSPHGLTAAYSELASSRLGQLYDVPVIRGNVVWVDPALIPNDVNVTQGFHVAFTYLAGRNFRPSDYSQIRNRAALPAAAVHLAWLRVGDQDGHNQFLWETQLTLPDGTRRDTNDFVLIDQAQMFGSMDWSALNFGASDDPYALPTRLRDQLTFADLQPVLDDVRQVSREQIVDCFSDCPDVWGITDAMIDGAADYLSARVNHLEAVLRANWP